ncbi:hypothetical protein AURDEDRAFT_164343 [Auricularia subglabra TFB-10046 SS5]|nr:hypothetical protein AURDEDRAFT_164343 [Auricularia subglabra TFB-10046 SS5]
MKLTNESRRESADSPAELRTVVAASVAAAAVILIVGAWLVWREWQKGQRRLRERARPYPPRRAQPAKTTGTGKGPGRVEIGELELPIGGRSVQGGGAETSYLRAELGRMHAENERLRSLVEPPQYSDSIPLEMRPKS